MRLTAEIIIIAALISLGWNKPFKEQFAQANTIITTKLSGSDRSCKNTRTPLCGGPRSAKIEIPLGRDEGGISSQLSTKNDQLLR